MNNRTLRVLHTADLHLGTTFRSLPDREVAAQLRQEHEQLIPRLLTTAREQAVDVLLLAGDLFDTPTADPRLVQRLIHGLGDLTGTESFICAGNHDPCLHESFWLGVDWPANVHFFAPGGPDSFVLPELDLRVSGASFSDVYASEPLYAVGERGEEAFQLLLLHGEITSPGSPSTYNPIRVGDLAGAGFDYAALGHIHLPQTGALGTEGALWRYPGAPQGRGFDELGLRGFWLGELSKSPVGGGRRARLEQQWTRRLEQQWTLLPSGARPFLIRDVEITAAETEQELQRLLEARLLELEHAEPELRWRDALLRIRLTGRPTLPYAPDPEHHRQALLALGYYYVEIEDATRPAYDPEQLRQETGFNAALMEIVDEQAGTHDAAALERALDLVLQMEREVRDGSA